METLKLGDILIRLSDNTQWRFLVYQTNKNTTLVSSGTTVPNPTFDKTQVYVEPVEPVKHKAGDDYARVIPVREFRRQESTDLPLLDD